MEISVFKSAKESHKSIGDITITDFLTKVKHGEWRYLIESIRSEENQEVKAELKRNLIGFTCSGTFDTRSKTLLKQIL